ncbi:MAG TPA: hypothetical protein PKL97_01490 [Candidatus Omnitrophota bacterium]|nr:hypothetical protein [Candidatus Omnitrophota bacterium]
MYKKCILTGLLLLFFLSTTPSPAVADDAENIAGFTSGFSRVLTSAFQLPLKLVNDTFTQPFPLGVLYGVIDGTVSTVTNLVGGTFEMAAAAAPYAKYAWIAAL